MDKKAHNSSDTGSKSVNPARETSLSKLIIWNISKALEKNPQLKLKSALKATQERLESSSADITSIVRQEADQRHLSCALLAWQQLGHDDCDSLYRFVENQLKKVEAERLAHSNKPHTPIVSYRSSENSDYVKDSVYSVSFNMGPVVKLPVEPKMVMRLENAQHDSTPMARVQKAGNDLKAKIEEACCLESGCVERLAQLDAHTKELRGRLARLARREAERVELLERAETAWRDLEMGYMRRLNAVTEKEEDMTRYIDKLVKERTENKEWCGKLAEQLKPLAEKAEKTREKQKQVEGTVCSRACERIKMSESAAREDSTLANMQCKVTQLDRDLQFKEEQMSRKLQNLQSELESQRGLTFEAERAMRAELDGLKEQLKEVSQELIREDAAIGNIKEEILDIQKEKSEITQDLQGCYQICDKAMQKKIDELKKKNEQLQALKDKVLDCKCKIPVEVGVTVKRTPSLAALCQCAPEDRYLESCSCTSLRSRLLTDLLSALFSGLQAELNSTGMKMPCQLLKCLEDRHNWDRASVVKSNLRNFFAKLLIGELDIAIATSIEKYHAKWVGTSCVDISRPIPHYDPSEHEGWEKRAFEKRAHKLASQLAEEMFEERADELVRKAKDIISKGPAPCECKPPKTTEAESRSSPNASKNTAAYPVLVQQPRIMKNIVVPTVGTKTARPGLNTTGNAQQEHWQRAINDVLGLRDQIADLKRASIRKEDLRLMERKITKIVQNASGPENRETAAKLKNTNSLVPPDSFKRGVKHQKNSGMAKTKKKPLYPNDLRETIGRRQHIVNWCLCGIHNSASKSSKGQRARNDPSDHSQSWNQKHSKVSICQMSSSIKQSKPIQQLLSIDDKKFMDDYSVKKSTCGSDCACFNKFPSCSSIDKLLEMLTKWTDDLNDVPGVEIYKKNSKKSKEKNDKKETKDKDIFRKTESQLRRADTKKLHGLDSKIDTITLDSSKNTTEIGGTHVPIIDSEYMGAVNLEKSNENFCKCVTMNIKNDAQNVKGDGKPQVKYIRSCKCGSNSLEVKNIGVEVEMTSLKDERLNEVRPKEVSPVDSLKNKSETETRTNSEKINRASDAQEFSNQPKTCDCGYDIKFLGVTLGTSDSNKRLANTPKNSTQSEGSSPLGNECVRKIPRSIIPVAHAIETTDMAKSKSVDKNQREALIRQCSSKEDKLKDYFANAKGEGAMEMNESVLVSTNYEIESTQEKRERCICCVNSFTEETNDLEVNTFLLLEEHLKKRLKELKGKCKSTCIQPKEENEMFTTVFNKIKHTVLESTNKMVCKCNDEAKTEGSWQRAYDLLREYIKMKVNRLQCNCASPNQSNIILPDITDKVCLMIESDLQRLKDICKCKNSEKSLSKNSHMIGGPHFLAAEKDVTHIINRVEKNSNEIVMEPLIITQNTSAQIIPDNKTKSCDAIQKNEYKTVDTQKPDLEDLKDCTYCGKCKNLDVNNKISVDVLTDHNSLLCAVLGLPTEVEKTKPLKNESNNVLPLPLVGYTVDCSCDNKLSSCVCSKSMIFENKDIADKILKNYARKPLPCKTDYIMKNTKTPALISSTTMCNTKTSVDGNDDIVLKDSTQNCNTMPVNNYTNTVGSTITDVDMLSSATGCATDDPLDWFECVPHIGPESLPTKSVRFHPGPPQSVLLSAVHRAKSELIGEQLTKLTDLLNQSCECSLVPICHVKMLMNDIENKLTHSKCTCDTLNSKVCPVHAVKII